MKHESMRMKGTACALALAFVLTAFVPIHLFSEEADADAAVEPDYTFYRYTIKFFSTSQDAKYIVWDFADGVVLDGRWEYYVQQHEEGIELSEEILAGIDAYKTLLAENGNSIYCPIHIYSEPGVYTYSITAYNPVGYVGESGMPYDGVFSTDDAGYDGGLFADTYDEAVCGSKDTAYITLDVKGYPVITLNNNGSVSQIVVENTEVYSKATEPAAPVRDGFDFRGWFTDSACTQAYDWDNLVTENITLYAGWTGTDVPPVEEPEIVTITVNGSSIALESGKKVSDIFVDPRNGFEFDGWYSDATFTHKVAGSTVLTQGMSLFAKYNAIQNEPSDDPSDEPTDDPGTQPIVPDDSKEGNEKNEIVPIAVCIVGLIVVFVGLRYHPAILVVGILIALAGIVDVAGIMEVF